MADTADGTPATRLWFGSAVVLRMAGTKAPKGESMVFRAMLVFHKVYASALLWGAARNVTEPDG